MRKSIQGNGYYTIPKLKMFTFKFYVDNKKAQVLLDIEPKEDDKRTIYFEKIESLKNILIDDYLPEAILERNFYLENGKVISQHLGRKTTR